MIWSLVLGIVVSLLVVEFTDWCPSIAAGLVRLIARLLPAADRDRYREEWLAEIEAVPGRLTRIVKAACLVVGVPGMRLAVACRTRPVSSETNDEAAVTVVVTETVTTLTRRELGDIGETRRRWSEGRIGSGLIAGTP